MGKHGAQKDMCGVFHIDIRVGINGNHIGVDADVRVDDDGDH